ncbi:MAG TPA: hypothetical protein VNK05_10725 [Chloroflexota bacterium]|nr:hypothetical protein [Chloroflexota bacterium]
MSERNDALAGVLSESVEAPAFPELPELPDVAGAFVEIRPGTWLRASSVVALSNGYPVAPRDPTRTRVSAVEPGGGSTAGAAAYRSPFTAAQLLSALRQAEHAEDVRRLEVLAHLLAALATRMR